jgi:hypothetical protein
MNKYNFDPRALIGWLRIARPGSVIGIQQDFMCNNVNKMRMMSLKRCESISNGHMLTDYTNRENH